MSSWPISKRLLCQSFPGLTISLIGLTFAGKWLDRSLSRKAYVKYSLLMSTNCIISFKGNVELILAMNLSTMSQSVNAQGFKYGRYALDNSCFTLAQSIAIGASVGLVSAVRAASMHSDGYLSANRIVASCMACCFVSSSLIVVAIITAVELCKTLQMDPDYIILPAISVFGDFSSVFLYVFFADTFDLAPEAHSTLSIFGICVLLAVFACASLLSRHRIPHQAPATVLATYLLSTTAGHILDLYSDRYKILASISPVFCGVCGAVAYIYLNKKATCQENGQEMCRSVFYTLLLVTAILALFYSTSALFLFRGVTLPFCILFVPSFVFHVYVLLVGTEYTAIAEPSRDTNIAVSAIPLLSSASDILGALILIGLLKTVALLGKA